MIANKAKAIGEQPIVLLIDKQGIRSEQLLAIIRRKKLAGIVVSRLKDGLAGYGHFLRNRLAMLSYQPVLNKNRGCGK